MLDRLTGLEVFAKVAAAGSLSPPAGPWACRRPWSPSTSPRSKPGWASSSFTAPRDGFRSPRPGATTSKRPSASSPTSKRPMPPSPRIASSREDCFGSMRRSRSARGRSRLCSRSSRERHPLVTVELGLNDRLVDLAEEGWDLAIRIGSLSNSSLIARRIAPCRTVVCAAPSYLEARGTPRTVSRPGGAQLSWIHAVAA